MWNRRQLCVLLISAGARFSGSMSLLQTTLMTLKLTISRWYQKFWVLVCKRLEAALWDCWESKVWRKRKGGHGSMHILDGKGQDKLAIWTNPRDLPSPPPWSSWVVWQRQHPSACYVSLRMKSASLMTHNQQCLWVNIKLCSTYIVRSMCI